MDKHKILNMLAEICNISEDTLTHMSNDDRLEDVGLDSLGLISFIVHLEKEFNVEILDSDLIPINFDTKTHMFQTLAKYFQSREMPKKCLILDCDNVLWKGISGEHEILIDDDVVGFQSELKRLVCHGVLVCLCSRNNEEFVMESLQHPDMLLQLNDFAVVKIDWRDKATKVLEISSELNLTTDSFVFVDDNEYEIGLINFSLPNIKTIKADYDAHCFVNEIISCFDMGANTNMDRTKLFREQKERERARLQYIDVKSYNDSLNTEIVCELGTIQNVQRYVELSQRTNQFNLSDKHYTESELVDRIQSSEYIVLSMSVKDKYGDMGVVGFAVIKDSIIESFMISCRAFDRDFEKVLLKQVKQMVPNLLGGYFQDNGKNGRFASFYLENGIVVIK